MTSRHMEGARASSGGKSSSASAQPAAAASAQRLEQRRSERNAKRELLFQVVREAMVRVGVLSSAFKFKVLSLDQRGRSFLVMIELAAEFSGEAEKLAEIETMIAQTAKHRFEIIVQAVYWRYFNAAQLAASNSAPVPLGITPAASAPAPLLGAAHSPISRPAPLFATDAHPALASSGAKPVGSSHPMSATHAASAAQSDAAPDPMSVTSSIPIIGATAAQLNASRALAPASTSSEELGDDEVAAFRRALAAGATQGAMAAPMTPSPAMMASLAKPSPVQPKPVSTLEAARTKLLLTGYEDTEMADDDPMPALSGTQYGELR
ncbi:MAG: hypothetical protein HC858_13495 [Brachymonas sp.]|nr:hypothetical protein [Brachymonas sp.]